jgi:hypothetical protein
VQAIWIKKQIEQRTTMESKVVPTLLGFDALTNGGSSNKIGTVRNIVANWYA